MATNDAPAALPPSTTRPPCRRRRPGRRRPTAARQEAASALALAGAASAEAPTVCTDSLSVTTKALDPGRTVFTWPPPPSHLKHGRLPQLNDFRWTGHNFDVVGDELLVRADYGRGVYAYDVSDPADPGWIAKSRGLARLVGDENRADPGRDRFGESYPLVWAAQYDPLRRLIFASDMNQGLYALALEPK